ncbi:MAG: thymidine phosphorylase [Chloroflexaceae bacterium]|nr:thymidine phosphorylase [Chloroflexaceae bacterium]
MHMVDLIARKRDGGTLETAEINWLITNYTQGNIPDYQMSAWAMAVLMTSMTLRETIDLSLAMARSGTMLDLSDIAPIVGDKHSTGGVGDKTTLLLCPMVAAVGLPIAKMSGRGLSFTGGTIDKLESIPGFRADLPTDLFRHVFREVGLVVASQTEDLAPADKQLYALRDVTATVQSTPLIAASVMSKKIAAGANCIVLDVKYGSGAFMRTLDDARLLTQTMVGVGQSCNRKVTGVISSMEQPLGRAIGNALEVREAIEGLHGEGPTDLVDLCRELGSRLLVLADKAESYEHATALLDEVLQSGAALEKFRQMVLYQGGSVGVITRPERLPQAPVVAPVSARTGGYVAAIDAQALGLAVGALGGGRARKGDTIDHRVGLVLEAKVGDAVEAGAPLLFIHAASDADARRVEQRLLDAYTISAEQVPPPPLIADVVEY